MCQQSVQRASKVAETALPEAVYSTQQVRDIDQRAIRECDIPGIELMSRAGKSAFAEIARSNPVARCVRIYCGSGNNAGDGYVVAAAAQQDGWDVEVVAVGDPAGLSGDAAAAFARAETAGVAIRAPADRLRDCDVIVDALLGTGLTRPVAGAFAEAVDAINRSAAQVVALDMPTGINSDTGQILGDAVRADLTVTFVGLKPGLFLGQAPDFTGTVRFDGLGIPPLAYQGLDPVMHTLPAGRLKVEFPKRSRMSHKGLNGKVLLIGGAPGMGGAIRLAGEAALRAGAGRVQIATHADSVATVMSGRPELMCRAVDAAEALPALLDGADAVVVGPGLGRGPWSTTLYSAVVDFAVKTGRPLVLDADALNLLAGSPWVPCDALLTPHPAEAGRLLGISTAAVQADRLAAVRALAEKYMASVVLKGACSLVLDQRDCYVCDRGNPGMATAGMGDVLAGVCGALAAGRRRIAGVAPTAVLLHAMAGDLAAQSGQRGTVAGDLMLPIRSLVNPV